MENSLDILTKYSNLILVIITGIYAYLTWKMVLEMKKARENQSDANLIASPIPMNSVYTQVQLENVGPGPAFNIELSISLEPSLQTLPRIWKHPAFLVGKKELFLLPVENIGGTLPSLREISEKHEKLIINVKWKNVFGKDKFSSGIYKLNELSEGWYKAGLLIQPEDMPTQTKEIVNKLGKISDEIAKTNQDIARLTQAIETIKSKKTTVTRKKKTK